MWKIIAMWRKLQIDNRETGRDERYGDFIKHEEVKTDSLFMSHYDIMTVIELWPIRENNTETTVCVCARLMRCIAYVCVCVL